uniref:DUF1422 family protein n=1 Tax=Thaumasiovibrio occultus TaxID=1891184 RepID=UPI000B364002|nr:DUF1422 family protein [Thaumasiovibrio occultus]
MEQSPSKIKRDILLFAGLCGISVNACLYSLTVDWVPLSMFPLFTLLLSAYCGYQSYSRTPNANGTTTVTAVVFICGLLGYSAYSRAIHPELGSNFVMLLLVMVLMGWVCFRTGIVSVNPPKKTH